MTERWQPTRAELDLSRVLEALSNPIRQRVVAAMAANPDAVYSCGDLLSDLPKSTATHHWRVLRESGVIGVNREGGRHCLRFDSTRTFVPCSNLPGTAVPIPASSFPCCCSASCRTR
jgi:DNA-binding transcriptional ArsR family regulator